MNTETLNSPLYVTTPYTDLDKQTGRIVWVENSGVNLIPVPVRAGSVLRPVWTDLQYKYYFYTPEIPPELIHTYTYQPEANWTTYSAGQSVTEWTREAYTVPADGYVRIVVSYSVRELYLCGLFRLELPSESGGETVPAWRTEELERLCRRVETVRQPGDLTILLLADTHYAAGGIWPETLESLRAASELLRPDGTVHLGDFTDGLLPSRVTGLLVKRMLAQLRALAPGFWCCIGNHDSNYFHGNPDRLSRRDCTKLYLGRKKPWYYEDFPEKNLRLIFLDSFDPTKEDRYGFDGAEVCWLRWALRTAPRGRKVLVFSHVPPLAEIHVWSDVIRNGEKVLSALEKYHRRRGAVLGWIHGHNHADQTYTARAFPIIGIGCAKLEDFPEHKPAGAITWPRERNTRTQELWDVLLVHASEGTAELLRFGAGEDRRIGGNTL